MFGSSMIVMAFRRLFQRSGILKDLTLSRLLRCQVLQQWLGSNSAFLAFLFRILVLAALLVVAAGFTDLLAIKDLPYRLWAVARLGLAVAILLFVPGYVVFVLTFKQKAITPDVPALAFFLGILILVIPGSIAYVLKLRLEQFTILYLSCVYAGLLLILHRIKNWAGLEWAQPRSKTWISSDIVVWFLFFVAGALMVRWGGYPGGDSVYHRAMVQRIVTTGITSDNLLWHGQTASTAYGWSPWHLVIAMISNLSQLSVQETWFYMDVVVVVVVLSTFYYFVREMTGNRLVAAMVTVLNAVVQIGLSPPDLPFRAFPWALLMYPNQIAFMSLVPLSVCFFWRLVCRKERRILWICGLATIATLLTHTFAYLLLVGIVLSALIFRTLLERKSDRTDWIAVCFGLFLIPAPFLLYRAWTFLNSGLSSILSGSTIYLDPDPVMQQQQHFFMDLGNGLGFMNPLVFVDDVFGNFYNLTTVFLVLGLLVLYSRKHPWARLLGYTILGMLLIYTNPLFMAMLLKIVPFPQLMRVNVWVSYYVIPISLCWFAYVALRWLTKGRWLTQGTVLIIVILVWGQHVASPLGSLGSIHTLNLMQYLKAWRLPFKDPDYSQFVQEHTPKDSTFMLNSSEQAYPRVFEQAFVEFAGRYIVDSAGWHIRTPNQQVIMFVMDPETGKEATVHAVQNAKVDYLFLQDASPALLRKHDVTFGMGARVYFDEKVVIYDVRGVDETWQMDEYLSKEQLLLEGIHSYSSKLLEIPQEPHNYLLLGQLYEWAGEWEIASSLFHQSLELAPSASFVSTFAQRRLEFIEQVSPVATRSDSITLLDMKTRLNLQDVGEEFHKIGTGDIQTKYLDSWDFCRLPGVKLELLSPECQVALLVQDEFDAHMSWARVHLELGLNDKAISELHQALDLSSDRTESQPHLYRLLGDAYQFDGYYTQAARFYNLSNRLDAAQRETDEAMVRVSDLLSTQTNIDGRSFHSTPSANVKVFNLPDARRVLFQHPPSQISYLISVVEPSWLCFSLAISSEVWQIGKGDGAQFDVYIDDGHTEWHPFSEYIDPKNVPAHRQWHDREIDLSLWAGQTVTITFATSPGPNDDNRYDWAGWGEPRIVQPIAFDFLEHFPEATITLFEDFGQVYTETQTINYETRPILFQHPTSRIVYPLTLPPQSTLRFGIGVDPAVWSQEKGDGVEYNVYVRYPDDPYNLYRVFQRYIDPKNNPDDRRWFDEHVDLSRFGGQLVEIIFEAQPGPVGDANYDWGGWSNPVLVSAPEPP